jgi:hypothetical protein
MQIILTIYDVTLRNDLVSEKTSRSSDIVHRYHKTVHMRFANVLQIYTIFSEIYRNISIGNHAMASTIRD